MRSVFSMQSSQASGSSCCMIIQVVCICYANIFMNSLYYVFELIFSWKPSHGIRTLHGLVTSLCCDLD